MYNDPFNPYALKAAQLKDLRKYLKHKQMMKGASAHVKLTRTSSVGKAAFESFQTRPVSGRNDANFLSRTGSTGKSILARPRRDSSLNKTGKTAMASSIYELVTTNVKVPDGLMYRGKYCGKSKLR